MSSDQRDLHSQLPACRTIVDLLQLRAACEPSAVAYRFLKDGETETDSLTYHELDQRARACGAYLQEQGLTNQQVLLLLPPGLEFVTTFLGCLYAGAIAVPAYPPRNLRGLPRIESILLDSKARTLITTARSLARTRTMLESAGFPGLQYIASEMVPDVAADHWSSCELRGDALAFLQYTSGSTALPKGVMVSHGNILSNQAMIQAAFQLTAEDVGLGWLPLFHDMGLIGHVVQPIYAGITSILMSPAAFLQKPVRWLQAISRYRATISGGPNFAYDLCVRKVPLEERSSLDLSSWRVAFTGAEPIRATTLDEFAGAFADSGFRSRAFLPCYGLAEATLMVSGGPADQPAVTPMLDGPDLERGRVTPARTESAGARAMVGCGEGRPGSLQGQRLVIVDPDARTACAPEEIGEIWVAGPHVAQGYWGRRNATRETFEAQLSDTGDGPFLRTGDLGFLQGDELVVTGRLKDLVVINGRNLYPQDIEWTVERNHPVFGVGAGAAFTIEEEGGDALVIVYELPPRARTDVDELIADMRRAVSEAHEVAVHHILIVKAGMVPRTSSGKIQRSAARARYLAGDLEEIGAWHMPSRALQAGTSASGAEQDVDAPAGFEQDDGPSAEAIRAWLLEQVADELCMPPSEIDPAEPFSVYGLASVEGVSLAAKLGDWLDRSIPLSLVWDYPSIDAVADHLAGSHLPTAA